MSQMVGPQRREARHETVGQISNTLNSYLLSDGIRTNQMTRLVNEDNCIDVGYYLHRKKLGEGGFGKVRLGTHLKTGHKVAVKIMNKQKLGADLHRVRIEINALKVLRHENIAKLLQVIETEEEIYLVLEYCSGGELFDYLVTHSRLSEIEAKTIMKDLVNALSFIHCNGFAHRDLKPENILFDDKHRIKLIDFGLAAHCRGNNSSLNHLKTCCGSPAYAAPELLCGPFYSGSSVDVWSAGVLLYALLVGRLPFDDENIPALYRKIQSGIYKTPDFLSNNAKDLIRGMLRTDPKERITIDQMLLHPWFRSISDGTNLCTSIMKENLDESALYECIKLFNGSHDMRQSIITGTGYRSATYWLIKINGIKTPAIDGVNSPQTKTQRRRSKSVDGLLNNENAIGSNNNENHVILEKIPEQKNVIRNLFYPKNGPNSPQTRIPVSVLSPKPIKLKEIKSPNNSPIPYKKARLMDSQKNTPIKSPLVKARSCSKTPMNAKVESTPKKSLLKRFLETATPARSHSPRLIKALTGAKTITLTEYTDPQKLIQKLSQTMSAKGIICKQKDYSLNCVLSTKNIIILSFCLEICKFQNNPKCVIQRKRLKGDAWNYKKVCEDILRISNERI